MIKAVWVPTRNLGSVQPKDFSRKFEVFPPLPLFQAHATEWKISRSILDLNIFHRFGGLGFRIAPSSTATTSLVELSDIKEDLLLQFNFVNHLDEFGLHLLKSHPRLIFLHTGKGMIHPQ